MESKNNEYTSDIPIVLIEPPQAILSGNEQIVALPPLGLAYISSSIKQAGYQVNIIDALGEGLEQKFIFKRQYFRGLTPTQILSLIPQETQIIGIRNLFTFTFPIVCEMIRLFKQHLHVKVILGGEHPTALPEYSLKLSGADVIVLGEGEQTIQELLPALLNATPLQQVDGIAFFSANEQFTQTARRKPIRDLKSIPWPDYDSFPVENYLRLNTSCGPSIGRWLPVLATRGCPYQCKFCTAPNMWNQWVPRKVEDVLAEMKHWYSKYGIIDFHFNDLTIGTNHIWIEQFSKAILESGLSITWQAVSGTRVDHFSYQTLDLMFRSGCRMICLAPETGSQRLCNQIGKAMDIEKILQVSSWCHQIGIKTGTFIVYGFPEENARDYLETFRWLIRLAKTGCDTVGVGVYHLLPGTVYFEQAIQEKRIKLSENWFQEIAKIGQPLLEASYSSVFRTPFSLQIIRWITIVWYHFHLWRQHPKKLVSLIRNTLFGKQETKLDRVIQIKFRRPFLYFFQKMKRFISFF